MPVPLSQPGWPPPLVRNRRRSALGFDGHEQLDVIPGFRNPPGGSAYSASQLAAATRPRAAAERLRKGLERRLGAAAVTLHASGREALRVAFAHLAEARAGNEILMAGYTCFSVPAAAVAAGLRVRLIDTDSEGRLDLPALADTPLGDAVALVVSNLFGVPEPVAAFAPRLRDARVALVDDAAQSLGAATPDGPVGSRGEVGVLSFGRGKPLCALGGGGLAWSTGGHPMAPEDPAARRVAALARGAAYNVALAPAIFGWLAAVPALGIGETSFDPDFARGSIDGASLCLASAVLPGLERAQQLRQQRARALAGAIGEHTGFSPLLASGADAGAYPRLGVLAPHPAARDEAVRVLTSIGVTAMYPSALTEIPELGPHLVGDTETPRSRDFASRLLTVPTNRALQERESALLIERLRELS